MKWNQGTRWGLLFVIIGLLAVWLFLIFIAKDPKAKSSAREQVELNTETKYDDEKSSKANPSLTEEPALSPSVKSAKVSDLSAEAEKQVHRIRQELFERANRAHQLEEGTHGGISKKLVGTSYSLLELRKLKDQAPQAVWQTLHDCSLNGQIRESVRASCFLEAAEWAQNSPERTSSLKSLKERLAPGVQRLVSVLY